MYIGPIQQTNKNSLNKVNFKQVAIRYRMLGCGAPYDANNKIVKDALEPIMEKVKRITCGYNVKFEVSYNSPGPYRPGERPKPFEDIVRITICNNNIAQLFPRVDLSDLMTRDYVVFNRYEIKEVEKDGDWINKKVNLIELTPEQLGEEIIRTLTSMTNCLLERLNRATKTANNLNIYI